MISDLISALSKAVTDELAANSLPQLVDGEIKLGQRYTDDAGAPRIWMIPRRFGFRAPSQSATATVATARRPAMIQRSLATVRTTLEVHVLGPASAPDVAEEFRFAELLRDLVIWAAQETMPGAYELADGDWEDQAGSSAVGVVQTPPQTHHIMFGLIVWCPVGDKPTGPRLAFVPPGTQEQAAVQYDGDAAEAQENV